MEASMCPFDKIKNIHERAQRWIINGGNSVVKFICLVDDSLDRDITDQRSKEAQVSLRLNG